MRLDYKLVVVTMALVVDNRPFTGPVLTLKTALEESLLVFLPCRFQAYCLQQTQGCNRLAVSAWSAVPLLAFPTSVRKSHFLQERAEAGPLVGSGIKRVKESL